MLRKEKELIAQRARPAEAERYKIETLAEANRCAAHTYTDLMASLVHSLCEGARPEL